MALEIERKFLVKGIAWKNANKEYYVQGYLNQDKQKTVRVRVAGEKGYLTVKGPSKGAVRQEFEYPIPKSDAEDMLKLCGKNVVEKIRYKVEFKGFIWEVDEFLGDNKGLITAEIELPSENTTFEKPEWIDTDITEDYRYSNSNLSSNPFSNWE